MRRIAEPEVREAVVRLGVELRANSWLGDKLRERYNLRLLSECRRIRFDRPDWKGKPRYRLVYRNEPDDGAPEIVRLVAVGTRESLAAYRAAASRLGTGRRRDG